MLPFRHCWHQLESRMAKDAITCEDVHVVIHASAIFHLIWSSQLIQYFKPSSGQFTEIWPSGLRPVVNVSDMICLNGRNITSSAGCDFYDSSVIQTLSNLVVVRGWRIGFLVHVQPRVYVYCLPYLDRTADQSGNTLLPSPLYGLLRRGSCFM